MQLAEQRKLNVDDPVDRYVSINRRKNPILPVHIFYCLVGRISISGIRHRETAANCGYSLLLRGERLSLDTAIYSSTAWLGTAIC